jgi:hypothetical protein
MQMDFKFMEVINPQNLSPIDIEYISSALKFCNNKQLYKKQQKTEAIYNL